LSKSVRALAGLQGGGGGHVGCTAHAPARLHRRFPPPCHPAADRIKWDPIDLRGVDTLILSFSRIRTIENMNTLNALVKLRLDNNDIQAITGLETLTRLRELDLSFNRITAIKGLSALTQLTDLSLYSNRITHLEGLDAQVGTLEFLSVGRNDIADQRSLLYLRRFTKLRVVVMEGNFKGMDAGEVRGSTIALLPSLRYLDYVFITDSERKAAVETHHRLVSDVADATATAGGGAATAAASGGGGGGSAVGGMGGRGSSLAATGVGGGGGGSDMVHSALGAPGAIPPPVASARPDGGGGVASSTAVEDAMMSNVAAVQEAGLQYLAFIWRIMMDPKSVADIAGLGPAAGTAATAAKKADGAGRGAGGGGGGGAAGGAPPAPAPAAAGGDMLSLSGDADHDAVFRISGIHDRVEMFREAIAALVDQAVMRGLGIHHDIQREVSAVSFVVQSYLDASDSQAKRLIDEYIHTQKHLLRESERSGGDGEGEGDSLRPSPTSASVTGVSSPLPTPTGAGTHGHGRHHGHHGHKASVGSGGGAGGGKGADEDVADDNSEIAAAQAALRALEALLEENDVLHTRLVGIESVLHEQALAVLQEFDAAYSESAGKRQDLFQKFFRAVEKEALATAEDAKTIMVAEVDEHQEYLAMHAAMSTSASAAGMGVPSMIPAHAASGAGELDAASPRDGEAAGGAAVVAGRDARVHAPGGGGAGSKLSSGGHEVGDDEDGGYGAGGGVPGGRVVDEEVNALLADREGSLVAVNNAFEHRVGRIFAAEDKTRWSERERERVLVKARLIAESDRHRQRMTEVNALHARNKADLEAMMLVEQNVLAEYAAE